MLIANKKTFRMYKEEEDLKGGKFLIEVCPYFEVVNLIKKLPESLKLPDEYEISYTNGKKSGIFRVSTEQLYDPVELGRIFGRNHFYVRRYRKDDVIEEIVGQADKIDSENKYSYENKSLGWLKIDNKNVFIYDTKVINGHTCTCVRPCGKFVNGDEITYDKMLESCVLDNAPMTLAYVLGFSSVIISRLSNLCDLGVMIVGITGISSKGKTTALKLIASIWGDTDDIQGTMILKNQGSEIGFSTQQAGLYGVPILFDDLDTNAKIDMGDFLYNFSKGTQRVVAKNNGDTDFSRMGFSGLGIITGENPLLSKTDQRMGLCVRVLDFADIIQAKDAETANKIKQCVCTNYGFKGKRFAEFVENISDNDLISMFDTCKEQVYAKIKVKDEFTDRIVKKYAVILLTAGLMNKCFGLTIDTNAVVDLALTAEEEQQRERNKSKNAYLAILDYYLSHKDNFEIRDCHNVIKYAHGEKMGIALYKADDVLCLKIPTLTTKNLLVKLGYNQIHSYRKEWKIKKYTNCENGRYDISNQELGRHYHFVYPNQKYNNNN